MTDPNDVIFRLDLSDPRMATRGAHARVRDLILSGQLPAGTVISQVELAKELGISRTPLREALRMLQEEGLIDSEPNRRSRVARFDASDMDAIYGVRLLIEALGMRLTLPTLDPASLKRAESLLEELESLGGPAAGEKWHRAHHEFHRTFVSGAPAPLVDQIMSYAQRSERYVYQHAHAASSDHSGRAGEHRQILEQVAARQFDEAVLSTARHLARTPLLIMAEIEIAIEPAQIRAALSMITSMAAAQTTGRTKGAAR